MASLHDLFFWNHDQFLGISWSGWKVVGLVGNVVFFSRFLVQWHATEKRKQVVVPTAFWWLSLVGSLLLLAYATFGRRDAVFILAYGVSWIPYVRNLIIHQRHANAHSACPACGAVCPPEAKFCHECGGRLAAGMPVGTIPVESKPRGGG